MTSGLFITFEGIDGCGKTTQWRLLTRYLESNGINLLATREPGGTALGAQIRKLVLEKTISDHSLAGSGAISSSAIPQLPPTPLAEALLYAADRAQHVETVLRPALLAGRVVLCDRYIDSTLAYQGIGRQRDLALIQNLVTIATQGLKPALTLLFDLPVAESQVRLHGSAAHRPAGQLDRLDSEPLDFHERVRTGYLSLAAAEPDRFRVLDACCDIETLHQRVVACLPPELLNRD